MSFFADGTRLFYKDWGRGDAIIFVHSWSLDSGIWDQFQASAIPMRLEAESAVEDQPQPRNGFGITALVVGLIAICLGLIPLFGQGAIIGGIIAMIFGLLGFGRARRRGATNKKMAWVQRQDFAEPCVTNIEGSPMR